MSRPAVIILVPNDTLVVGDDDDLHPELIKLILAMAEIRYWPLDAGEDKEGYTELEFVADDNIDECRRLAKYYITRKGYV